MRTPPSLRSVRQPGIPQCLEGLYCNGGSVRSHVQRLEVVDRTGVPPLLLSGRDRQVEGNVQFRS